MSDSFTKERIEEIKEGLKLHDKKNNCTISTRDFQVAMKSFGVTINEMECQEIICEADPEGRGFLGFDEFIYQLNKKLIKQREISELLEACKAYDSNKNGLIHKSNFKKILENLGEKFTPFEIEEILNEIEIDKDGNLHYNDTIAILTMTK